MPAPTLTDPPAGGAPDIADKATFAAKADAAFAWLFVVFPEMKVVAAWVADRVTEITGYVTTVSAAAAGAVSAGIYVATSVTARSAQSGSQTHTLTETSRGFATNDRVVAIRRGAPDVRKRGNVPGYASNVLTVTWDDVPAGAGATTYTDWMIMLAALEVCAPVTAADILAGVKVNGTYTPDAASDAREPLAVTAGGSYTPSLANTVVLDITLSANLTLNFPTGIGRAGQPFIMRFRQPATGGPYTITANSNYRLAGLVAPTLSTAANACDELSGYVLAGKTAASCVFRRNV